MDSETRKKLDRIESALNKAPSSGTVSVLPDYFVDRFVRLDDFQELASAIKSKGVQGGGGSIRGSRQSEVKGGNAVNLAFALGSFGMVVNLITVANSLPAEMLRSTFHQVPSVNVDIIDGKPGFTVAFEFKESGRLVNVMVSDPGDLKKIDGSGLSEAHWEKISESKIVSFVNWASIDYGTDLAEKLFSFARERNIKTFFDPADVLEKENDLLDFKKRIMDKALIDYFSMNDNEARIISRAIASHILTQDYSEAELKKTISIIADHTGGTVDVHTHKVSMSCSRGEVTADRCHKVIQKTVTGAGDVWDAADMIGYLTGLEPEDRLYLANGAGGLYVSRESAMPPTASEVLNFLKSES